MLRRSLWMTLLALTLTAAPNSDSDGANSKTLTEPLPSNSAFGS
jgi:hypothetical protein